MLSEKDKRWDRFISEICYRDSATLSEIQKKAVLCFWYDAEMNNGGFSGYSDVFPDTDLKELESALKEIANETMKKKMGFNYIELSNPCRKTKINISRSCIRRFKINF